MMKGILPSTLRGACIAAGELATYDHAKTTIKQVLPGEEGPILHVVASLLTGLVATSVAAPFDLIKTRLVTLILSFILFIIYVYM